MDLLGEELETRRLRLRAVSPEDRDAIFATFTDEVTVYMEPRAPSVPEETAKFIAGARERMRRGEEWVCAVLDRATGRFLGLAGLHELKAPAPELGIWIAVAEQGAGRGREAVEALVEWGSRRRPRTAFFRYPVDRANTPSRRLAESLDGEVAHSYERRTPDGRTLDLLEYHVPARRAPPERSGD